MAFYCSKRACFVDKSTNKRLRGLWRVTSAKYCPIYTPPPGLGKRTRYSGLEAGKNLDEAVTAIISNNKAALKAIPQWHCRLALKIVQTLRKAKICYLKSQVVVHNKEKGIATAVDILGRSTRSKKTWILELKYCGHRIENVKRCYRRASPKHPRMKKLFRANSLHERHQLQLRETVKLFCHSTKTPKANIEAGVLVACGCGSLIFYKGA